MRFLVNGKNRSPVPPEAFPALLDAMLAWISRYKGKMEVWGFAGIPGGGGIINVDSVEEMDSIMVEFPLGPFTDTEIIPLVEIEPQLQHIKQVVQAMAVGAPS